MNELIKNRYVIYFGGAAGGVGALVQDTIKAGFTFGSFVGLATLVIIMVWAWGKLCHDTP